MVSISIGWFFLALAAVYAAVAIRDHRRMHGTPSPARRGWRLIAIIFALVGAALQLVRLI
jgi:uncharacterized membrane protein YdcZ (DUF606 family)